MSFCSDKPQWAYVLPCRAAVLRDYLVEQGVFDQGVPEGINFWHFLVTVGKKHGLNHAGFEWRDCFDWDLYNCESEEDYSYPGIVLYRDKIPDTQEDIDRVGSANKELKETLHIEGEMRWCLINYDKALSGSEKDIPQLAERPDVFTETK